MQQSLVVSFADWTTGRIVLSLPCVCIGKVCPGGQICEEEPAGSGKAAAYVYSIAPKDGTTIGALMPGVIIDPLLQKHSTGGFDATKFTYLGVC